MLRYHSVIALAPQLQEDTHLHVLACDADAAGWVFPYIVLSSGHTGSAVMLGKRDSLCRDFTAGSFIDLFSLSVH